MLMADVFSKAKRSQIMSRIKYKDTKPELYFSKILKINKLKYKDHPKIFGMPDFYIPTMKMTIFIDGCFWHGCNKCFKTPLTNRDFWLKKITNNMKRDRSVNIKLRKLGYHIMRIKECELEKFIKGGTEAISKKSTLSGFVQLVQTNGVNG
jgi:DNA mismatch endonuclease (patch repair protein)